MIDTTTAFVQLLRSGTEKLHLVHIVSAIDLAPENLRSSFLGTTCALLAETCGHALRTGVQLPVGGYFGLDTDAASRAPQIALQANRMMAAAANQDNGLLNDLIIATIPTHGGHDAATLIMKLASAARRLHHTFCHGTSGNSSEAGL